MFARAIFFLSIFLGLGTGKAYSSEAGLRGFIDNRLDIEVLMDSYGDSVQDANLVFSRKVDTPLGLDYDPFKGVERITQGSRTTVGVMTVDRNAEANTGVYNDSRSDRICSQLSGMDAELATAAPGKLEARVLDSDTDEASSQILLGRTSEGTELVAVWMRPGEQVTSVVMEDRRSRKKARRTELLRANSELVVESTGKQSRVCFAVED